MANLIVSLLFSAQNMAFFRADLIKCELLASLQACRAPSSYEIEQGG